MTGKVDKAQVVTKGSAYVIASDQAHKEYRYSVAERFLGIQGEGYWTGTPMAFVRLSGCPVGGPDGICTKWNGERFACDTGANYTRGDEVEYHPYSEINERLTGEDIWCWVTSIGCNRLLLTGGEPLAYDLVPLIVSKPQNVYLHIETSGTIGEPDQPPWPQLFNPWLTVSPKGTGPWPALRRASEVKLLVGATDTSRDIVQWTTQESPGCSLIYLQPLEYSDPKLTHLALQSAINTVLLYPYRFRLSAQLHKYLHLR